MDSKMFLSMESLCRTCMGEEHDITGQKTVSIFNEAKSMENSNITIMQLLILTTPQLNIAKDDMLPKILCEKCVDSLLKVHKFQEMCINAEQRLTEVLNEHNTDIHQKNTDPLTEGDFEIDSKCDLINTLKIEMDEPLINPDDIIVNGDDDVFDDFNYVPTSSDDDGDDSEWELTNNKPNKTKILKESKDNSKLQEHSQDKCFDNNAKEMTNNSVITNIPKNSKIYEFECDECGNRLKTLKSLKRHKLIHLRSPVKKDETDELDKTSETDNQSMTNKSATTNRPDDEKSSYEFECDVCGSRLKSRKSLKRHKKIHLRPPGVPKEKPKKIGTQTIYECEYCKKVFTKSSGLNDHIRLHTGELPYLCSECGKSFRKSTNLKQHLLRHGTARPYVCPDCPKDFPTLSDLASHKAVHTKTKSHVCDVCGAAFVKPYLLKAHKMYHTGEKNHKCEYCDRRFVTGDQCRRHMRTHTGEKPYKCKYCERAFAQSNDLMKHLRSHLGDNVYTCSMCPRGFRLHGDLREHFNAHKNDDEETKLRNLQALRDEELRLQIKFGLIEAT